MTIINEYKNGPVSVKLYADGTKERYTDLNSWKDANNQLEFPESMDLKITNYCDLACQFCHEDSTRNGKHAEPSVIMDRLLGLPKGVELAIGGGNPLDHPMISTLLKSFQFRGWISNITVNAKHFKQAYYNIRITELINEGLIKGLGISYRDVTDLKEINSFNYDNKVVHCIVGVHSYEEIAEVAKNNKVLLLGYKRIRRGEKYYNSLIDNNLEKLQANLVTLLLRGDISFDNLAIKQLQLERLLTEEAWSTYFMGDDGDVTIYYDAVEDEFAPSSISDRREKSSTAIKYFQQLKK